MLLALLSLTSFTILFLSAIGLCGLHAIEVLFNNTSGDK